MSEVSVPDLNPFSHEFHEDPYSVYAVLRDRAPVYRNDELDFFALTRYEDVSRALRDPATFVSGKGTLLEAMGNIDYSTALAEEPMILFLDPPYHTKLRRLVAQAFTSRSVRRMEPYVRELSERLCDRIAERGAGDFVRDFAAPLPMNVIFEMIGVPQRDREQVREWIDRSLDRVPEPPFIPEHAIEASLQGSAYTKELVSGRAGCPVADLVGDLMAAEIDDPEEGTRKLTLGELSGFVGLLGGAGNETITKMLANTVVLLQHHPTARERVTLDPGALEAAIEESLRYWPPAHYDGRTSTRPVELHGRTIPEGAKVLLFLGAANRDPRAFDDPDVFDIDRARTHEHLAFGLGIHFCLGASLARLQARIGLETFLRRFPDYRIDEGGLERVHSSNVLGFERAPFRIE